MRMVGCEHWRGSWRVTPEQFRDRKYQPFLLFSGAWREVCVPKSLAAIGEDLGSVSSTYIR